MAPLQHHFELAGWAEITIVIRFWILAGICVALGLGLFYSEWLTASAELAMTGQAVAAAARTCWSPGPGSPAGAAARGAAAPRARG